MTRFWVGGYGHGMEGTADGIGLLAADSGQGVTTLAYRGAVTDTPASPTWLAQHPSLDVVYAALEGGAVVQAFVRTSETTLAPFGEPVEAGASVCHIAVAPNGSVLIASCYGDGRVVRIRIDAQGCPVENAGNKPALHPSRHTEAQSETEPAGTGSAASDPHAAGGDRVSRAHAAVFLPDGRIATTDLGFDMVRIWRTVATGLALDHEVTLPLGTGPRHMVVHPSGHLHVVTEYSCEVFTLGAHPDGTWSIISSVLSNPMAQVGTDFPAELARTSDGAFLYTALRGSNTIAGLRVSGGGEILEPIALADSGVDWPRHHLLYEGRLLVAGQLSDTIALLDLDERTGAPLGIRHEAQAPSPTCLLLVR